MSSINITNHPLAANLYFYLDGDLYKVLQHIKASDYLTAWNFHKNGMEEFILSDVKRRAEPAFRTKEVGELMNRTSITIRDIYQEGHIPRPKKTYPLGDGKFTPLLYSAILWSKEDIYNLHDYYLERELVKGVKRQPGKTGRQDIPTRAELRAALEHGTVYYVKDSKTGEMRKVWKAESL